MSYRVISTDPFEREVKRLSRKYPSLKTDLQTLFGQLEENPLVGSPLGKNCYKIRLAIKSKGKGKSGGGRIITFVQIRNEKVFLVTLYDKGEKGTVSDDELEQLLKMIGLK